MPGEIRMRGRRNRWAEAPPCDAWQALVAVGRAEVIPEPERQLLDGDTHGSPENLLALLYLSTSI